MSVDTIAFTLSGRDLLACLLPFHPIDAIDDRDRHFSDPALENAAQAWQIPGGGLEPGESLDDAALRLLSGAIGTSDLTLQQLYTFGDPGRDPRERVISVAYFALVAADRLTPEALSNTTPNESGTVWHSVYQLPPLAFDHAEILNYALTRLRYKIEYSAVAFQLLPEEFTLRELQDAYMIILNDHKLDKANFRKKIREANVVESVQRYRETGGRPAELYRFRKDAQLEVKARRFFP